MDHPGGATSHCHYEEASPSSDLIREPAVYNCSGSGVFYSAELERTLEKSKETSEELSQNFQGEVFRKVFRKVSKNSRGPPGVVGACGALGNPGPPGLSGGPGVFGDVISPGRQKRKWKYLRKLLWMCVSIILFTHVHLGAAQILGDRTDSWNPERKPFRKDLVDPGDGCLLARGNFTSHFTLSIATTASYMCDLNFFTGNVSHFCNIYKDAGNHCLQTGWSVSVKAEGHGTSEFELSVEFLNVERGFDYCIYLQAPDNFIIFSGSVNVSGTAMQNRSGPGTTMAAKPDGWKPIGISFIVLFSLALVFAVLSGIYIVYVKNPEKQWRTLPKQSKYSLSTDSGAASGLNTRDGSLAEVAAVKESISIPLADQEDLSG